MYGKNSVITTGTKRYKNSRTTILMVLTASVPVICKSWQWWFQGPNLSCTITNCKHFELIIW